MAFLDGPQVFHGELVARVVIIDELGVHLAEQHQITEMSQVINVVAVPLLMPCAARFRADNVGDLPHPAVFCGNEPCRAAGITPCALVPREYE